MIARAHIGFTTAAGEIAIEAARVRLFCQAIGETDPAAWQTGQPAPPTYLKTVENEHYSSAALLQQLDLPLLRVLHAEQSFEHIEPVRVGDVVTVQRQVADIYEKKDGALEFIVVDTRYTVEHKTVALARQTIVIRNLAPAS